MAGDFASGENETEVGAEIKVKVDCLVKDLSSCKLELQRHASEQLRSLAKRNPYNRDYIGKAGAISTLVELLRKVQDSQFQVHAVTALLNLSLNHSLKESIVKADAIDSLVEVLKNGALEARENAAATLFSLSSSPTHKSKIGESGVFPPLVELLRDGSPRGRRDAASLIFNLAILSTNKALAVGAGAVQVLVTLMTDESSKLHDEALAVLALLSGDEEGQFAISQADAIMPLLVDLVATGVPRNQENAVGIILDLGKNCPEQVEEAVKLGLYGSLGELASTGTEKGRRRARRLLRLIYTLRMMDGMDNGSPGGGSSRSSSGSYY
ncbi:unnamed protein product [Calypogeia fissa]